MYKNANTKEITIKLQIEDSKELQNIIEKIEKIQKEHSGDCILSVRFPMVMQKIIRGFMV